MRVGSVCLYLAGFPARARVSAPQLLDSQSLTVPERANSRAYLHAIFKEQGDTQSQKHEENADDDVCGALCTDARDVRTSHEADRPSWQRTACVSPRRPHHHLSGCGWGGRQAIGQPWRRAWRSASSQNRRRWLPTPRLDACTGRRSQEQDTVPWPMPLALGSRGDPAHLPCEAPAAVTHSPREHRAWHGHGSSVLAGGSAPRLRTVTSARAGQRHG